MKTIRPRVLLVALLHATTAFAAESPIERWNSSLVAIDDDILAHGQSYDVERLSQAFGTGVSREDLASSTTSDIETSFRAAALVAERSGRASHVGAMRKAFDALVHRGAAREVHVRQMVLTYLAVRELKSARVLVAKLPRDRRIVIPTIVDRVAKHSAVPTVLRPDERGRRWVLERETVELGNKAIVIVASPACSFSSKFFERAAQSAELSLLLRHATIVLPQSGNLLTEEIGDWNRKHPEFPMRSVYAASEWPLIDWWGTPTFYFVDGGKVTAKIIGWQPEVSEQKLLNAYRAWKSGESPTGG
jgi:hypothetical protein